MSDRFQNKYRISSARAKWWNYGWDGAYFITICTRNRESYFGEIIEIPNDGVLTINQSTKQLSDQNHIVSPSITLFSESLMGELAKRFWYEIADHFPYCKLGDFVVMPNHIHGILMLNNVDWGKKSNISMQDAVKMKQGGFAREMNPMIHKNISRIIRWYKGRCSFELRKIHADFSWQTRFHDHIIRDGEEYQRIVDYIVNNPANWKKDKFYSL